MIQARSRGRGKGGGRGAPAPPEFLEKTILQKNYKNILRQ